MSVVTVLPNMKGLADYLQEPLRLRERYILAYTPAGSKAHIRPPGRSVCLCGEWRATPLPTPLDASVVPETGICRGCWKYYKRYKHEAQP